MKHKNYNFDRNSESFLNGFAGARKSAFHFGENMLPARPWASYASTSYVSQSIVDKIYSCFSFVSRKNKILRRGKTALPLSSLPSPHKVGLDISIKRTLW